MNSCILMAEIIQEPQLRYTADNLEITEMMVQFPGLRADDPPAMLKVVGWGNLAKDIQQNYHQGDRVLLEGRLSMSTIERPEGFKEKRAELTAQRIHSLGAVFTHGSSPSMARNSSATDSSSQGSEVGVGVTPPASNFQVPASQVSSPVGSSQQAVPSYESPFTTPTPATNNLGVMSQDNQNKPTPETKNFERGAYNSAPTNENQDMDDIPF